MKRYTNLVTVILGTIFLPIYAQQQSLELVDLSATISGTSTMHDWTSKVNEIIFEGQVNLGNGIISNLQNVTVIVPVSSIKSDRGNLMDRNTWNSLKIEEYPEINFTLSEALILNKLNGVFDITAVGELTLVGNSRTTKIDMSATLSDPKTLLIRGSKDILMSDYQMKAPSFLFGAYTTGDLVTFKFDMTLRLIENDQPSNKMN